MKINVHEPKSGIHSLKFRIWFTFIAFALVIVMTLWLFQVVFINGYYSSMKEKTTLSAADEVKQLLTTYVNDEDTLNTQMYAAANKYQTSITIINESTSERSTYPFMPEIAEDGGGGRFDKFVVKSAVSETLISELKNEINANGNGEVIKYYEESSMLIYGGSLTLNGTTYLTVVSSKLQRLDEVVGVISNQLIIVSICLVLASFIASILIANRVSRPLNKITEKAQLLSEGDYDVVFDERHRGNYVEISKLAHTLNYATNGLKQVEKLRAEFIANVSHDLRTPLTMIKAYAEMIRDISGDDKEKRDKHLEVIIQESDRLSELVSDLLDVSQLQAGALAYDPSVFDMTALVEKVVSRLDILCERMGKHINVNTTESVYAVGDIKKIQQVVYNLVTNALNYSDDSTEIDVAIEENENDIKFSVKDYGRGISEEDLPNIWDRYYRVDKEHKRSVAGTGIGLSIVKSVLEMHGTEYGVESQIGSGSTFWFKLNKPEEGEDEE